MSDKAMVHSGASVSIPVEGGAMPMLEKAARALAAAMGYDFDAAFDDKSAWIKARGDNGRGFVDINEPFKCDFVDGARAVLETVREPSFEVNEAGRNTQERWEEHVDLYRAFPAMIDHILNEAKQ